MKVKSIALIGALVLGSNIVNAGAAADRWESLSEERQEHIIARAAEHGFDATTEEGRQAMRETRMERREVIRAGMSALSDDERAALRAEMQGLSRQDRRELLRANFSLEG